MHRFDQHLIAEAILSAPGWVRVGITMPEQRMRLRVADGLAQSIVEQLGSEDDVGSDAQLTSPMLTAALAVDSLEE